MDIEDLKRQINDVIDQWAKPKSGVVYSNLEAAIESPEEAEIEFKKPERTDGKRAIRTKDTGDNVYLIDDNAKTKAWVTKPEVLESLGFTMADVEEVDPATLVGHQMQPSLYKVDG